MQGHIPRAASFEYGSINLGKAREIHNNTGLHPRGRSGRGILKRPRILILEANRYHALLIERELATRFPAAVLAKFESDAAALEELRRTHYDVAIVDTETPAQGSNSFFESFRDLSQSTVLIVVGSAGARFSQTEASGNGADVFISRDNNCYRVLPDVIRELFNRRHQSSDHPDVDGSLDAQARSRVISLTVNTLAHEINNPLMTILGTTELLLNNGHNISSCEIDKIRMIRESARRIESTLVDLANISSPAFRETSAGLLIDPKRSTG